MKVDITIDKNALRALEHGFNVLGGAAVRRVTKRASNVAMTPVVREAKTRTPRRHGLLRKSIGKRQKMYKGSGTVVTMVGARTGFGKDIDGKRHDPTFYAHLVELGTRHSPPQPFLRPAHQVLETSTVNKFRQNALAGMNREIAKLAKK